MTYFPDFSAYTYTPNDKTGALNIGWLDASQPFQSGTTRSEFHAGLALLCSRPILLHRGRHECQFCRNAWGNGQVRVVGADGRLYAAPTLVHHYVVEHHYKPPEEFILAVIAMAGIRPPT